MSQALVDPSDLPSATEEQIRSRAAQLVRLANDRGISQLAFASPGRLRGHVSKDAEPFALFDFQLHATELVGAEVALLSDGALGNENVSPDLVSASPL